MLEVLRINPSLTQFDSSEEPFCRRKTSLTGTRCSLVYCFSRRIHLANEINRLAMKRIFCNSCFQGMRIACSCRCPNPGCLPRRRTRTIRTTSMPATSTWVGCIVHSRCQSINCILYSMNNNMPCGSDGNRMTSWMTMMMMVMMVMRRRRRWRRWRWCNYIGVIIYFYFFQSYTDKNAYIATQGQYSLYNHIKL